VREHLVNLALKLVGCPYIWGGQNPWVGLDCSGFIIWIYQVFGLLPSGDWTAQGLVHGVPGHMVESWAELAPGDLVFYGVTEGKVSHVMLFAGGGLVVGASGGGRDTITREVATQRGAQVKVKLWNYRSDAAAFLHVEFPDD